MSLERALARAFLTEHPGEAALALERMSLHTRAAVVAAMPEEAAAALQLMMPSAVALSLSHLPEARAAEALDRMDVDHAVAALRRLPEEASARILRSLATDKREALGAVLRYPEGTAAALMDPAVTALPDDIAVAEARVRLRREPRGLLHYLYVTDRTRTLVGVLDISELMRAGARDPLRSVMHDEVDHLPAWTPAAAVRTHPGWRSFHAMPVTDEAGRLLGAIRYQTLRRLEQEAAAMRGEQLTAVTVGALGELFHLGMAGFIGGVATAATRRGDRSARPPAATEGGAR